MKYDAISQRMKDYEQRNQYYLQRKIPVIIRVDMRSGHTFTKNFEKPIDPVFLTAIQNTMLYCCEHIEGCVLGYCQSDEITFVLQDYAGIETEAWFKYRIDKLCSIVASMATMAFIQEFYERIKLIKDATRVNIYTEAIHQGVMFDARCFNLPKEEVCNLIYWRQLDASRNSIQGWGQKFFSHKELLNKSCDEIQNMLMTHYDFNWNHLPTHLKRGCACRKLTYKIDIARQHDSLTKWTLDYEMPILKGEDRAYVNELIFIGES